MPKSIYLFYGDETFLQDEELKSLIRNYPNPDLNVEKIDGEKLTLEQFASLLQTSSMFAPEKLIIINDCDTKLAEQLGFSSVIKNISSGISVVFRFSQVDKRTKLFRLLNEVAEVVEFKPFAPWEMTELINWIIKQAKATGKKISEVAARQLLEICGNNLRLLARELEKIATYVGERGEINEKDVLALASPGETDAFLLLAALRTKDSLTALRVFQALLIEREDILSLLGLMTTQYRLLLQLKSLSNRESDPWKIAKQIGGSPFFIKKCWPYLNRFSLTELKNNLELLLETNLKIKTGVSSVATMELLILELCGATNA